MRISRIENGVSRSITKLIGDQYEVIIGDRREIINTYFEARYTFDNGFDEEVDNGNVKTKENTNGSEEKVSKKGKRSNKKARGSGVSSSRATKGIQEFSGESREDSQAENIISTE